MLREKRGVDGRGEDGGMWEMFVRAPFWGFLPEYRLRSLTLIAPQGKKSILESLFPAFLHHMGSPFVEIYQKTVRKSGFSRRNILIPLPYLLAEGRDFFVLEPQ